MALYLPSIAVQLSGRLDGVVFSHNRGGPYVRAHNATPTDPGTSRQLKLRAAVATTVSNWHALTADQRQAWERFSLAFPRPSRVGQVHPKGGYAEFCRANISRRYFTVLGFTGLGVINTPPTTGAGDPPVVTFSLGPLSNQFQVAWPGSPQWATNTGAALLLYVSAPQKATINWFRSPMLSDFCVKKTLANLTSPQTLTFASAPSAPTPAVFIRARVTNADGRLSAWTITRLSI